MESAKMILVMAAICGVCGFLLAGVKHATADRIEDQVMRYVKGPAVRKVLASATNNPVQDRRLVKLGDDQVTVFIGRQGGEIASLAYETTAEGFGGQMGVMVGYDVKTDRLLGIGITSHRETPGIGARVTQDAFTDGFAGRPIDSNFHVKKDAGDIDAVTGATISSRAACAAVRENVKRYAEIKQQVINRDFPSETR